MSKNRKSEINGGAQVTTEQSSISSAIRHNIRKLGLFSTLLDDDIDILVRHAKIRSLDEGETLFLEGDSGDFFAVVIEGQIDIIKQPEHESPVTIASLREGATLGEMAIIDHETRSATAIAAVPSTIFELSSESFDELVEISPRCGVKVIRKIATVLCNNVRRTSNIVTEIS